jgi:hypothetical protein
VPGWTKPICIGRHAFGDQVSRQMYLQRWCMLNSAYSSTDRPTLSPQDQGSSRSHTHPPTAPRLRNCLSTITKAKVSLWQCTTPTRVSMALHTPRSRWLSPRTCHCSCPRRSKLARASLLLHWQGASSLRIDRRVGRYCSMRRREPGREVSAGIDDLEGVASQEQGLAFGHGDSYVDGWTN